jgi:diacylglycerol kinase (ATP)
VQTIGFTALWVAEKPLVAMIATICCFGLANLASAVQRSAFPDGSPGSSDFSLKRLLSATANSLRGLIDGVRTEPAVREEAILLAVGLPLGLVIAPSAAWYVAMIGAILVVLAVEFLNTAIEKLADHVTREQHGDIGRIKDFGSAAVFCALALVGLVWLTALAVRCGLL